MLSESQALYHWQERNAWPLVPESNRPCDRHSDASSVPSLALYIVRRCCSFFHAPLSHLSLTSFLQDQTSWPWRPCPRREWHGLPLLRGLSLGGGVEVVCQAVALEPIPSKTQAKQAVSLVRGCAEFSQQQQYTQKRDSLHNWSLCSTPSRQCYRPLAVCCNLKQY